MPSSKQPERWTSEELAIAGYYISRKVLFSGETAHDVIKLRFPNGEERSASACSAQFSTERAKMLVNPYNRFSKKYNLYIVDEWLSREVPDKEELEKLLGIKDDKVVDEEVLKIFRKREVTV